MCLICQLTFSRLRCLWKFSCSPSEGKSKTQNVWKLLLCNIINYNITVICSCMIYFCLTTTNDRQVILYFLNAQNCFRFSAVLKVWMRCCSTPSDMLNTYITYANSISQTIQQRNARKEILFRKCFGCKAISE